MNSSVQPEIRRLDSEHAWDGVLQSVPGKTIFHSRKWLDLVTRTNKVNLFLGGVYLGRELVGLFPIIRFRRGVFCIAGSPVGFSGFSTPYLGPVVPDELLIPTLEAFRRWLGREKADYSEMALDYELPPAIWSHLGYNVTQRHTIFVEIPKRSDALWHVLAPRCRRHINKAKSSQVRVVEVADKAFFSSYRSMAADVYKKAHRPPPNSIAYYEGLWEACHDTGELRVLAAIHEGRLVAAGIFLLDREHNRAYYLDGAYYSRYSELRPNNLVQWCFLEQLVNEGYEIYDMLGADHEGIRNFKLSFGGVVRPYDYAHRADSILARLAREAYRAFAPISRHFKYQLNRLSTAREAANEREMWAKDSI